MGFSKIYEDSEFLEAVRELSPAKTTEVADEVGCSEKAAYQRLKELEENGEVQGKKLHRNLMLWGTPEGEKLKEI